MDWVDILKDAYAQCLKDIPLSFDFIVVNDCSTRDLTADFQALITAIPGIKIFHLLNNKGKGYALRYGVAQAQSDYYIYTDIDFPYTHASLLAILTELQKGTDIAVGIKNKDYYLHTPTSRKIISQTLRFFIKNFLRLKVSDTQCGLKGFNNMGKTFFLKTSIDRYLFDLEFIYLSSKEKNIRLHPIEVTLKPNIIFRKMNTKIILQEAKNFIRLLFLR